MKIRVGRSTVEMVEGGDRICAKVAAGEQFEPRSLELWATATQCGGRVLDIGAYTGLYSIAAALRGCDVVAFEPMPFNADRLLDNALLNQVDHRIDLKRVAVSNLVGRTLISYKKSVAYTSGASLVKRSGDMLPVDLVTIDSFGYNQVTAIKIDVERAEPLVLQGALDTIARCRPVILIEVLSDELKKEVRALLPDYRVAEQTDTRNWVMVPKC
jgi:FkbM family methyltransferase